MSVANKRILVQWIGHSDLRAMASSLPKSDQVEFQARLKGELPQNGDLGPIKTLLENESFDEVRLLSNYPKEWNEKYRAWLDPNAVVVPVELRKPTDYAAIFRIADSELTAIRDQHRKSPYELCLHLSPGTPAMAAVWLLLGKTRYPATFYETYAGQSSITEVPFDLSIDVLPEMLKKPDNVLQHLASQSPSEVEGFQEIAGDSPSIRDAVGRAKRAAMRGVSVLLLGESGTGKEMFARAIHEASPRRGKTFTAINCAAISKTLLESELFGHVRGAFTGANRERKGAFELTDGGTLFLDEVGECDLEIQAKLLRVLQPLTGQGPSVRTFRRVGDSQDRSADVRIVAATNRDLHKEIKEGRFREDLFYRLATITINLPPLRHRKSDIPEIAEKLLVQINRIFESEEPGYTHKILSDTAKDFVVKHDWPGNVRQLHNVLVQATVLSDDTILDRSDIIAALGELPDPNRSSDEGFDGPIPEGFDLEEHLNRIREKYLRRAMSQSGGVKAQAARLLGFSSYQALAFQLKRLKIDTK
jgi:DNA-binding NtrC family response regulator